jgi:hypothetical protein
MAGCRGDGVPYSQLANGSNISVGGFAALRQAFEDGSTARDELSRMIRAEYESEISHLKSTIAAVRAQLEQTERETQEAVARAIGDAAREIAQLRQTIH